MHFAMLCYNIICISLYIYIVYNIYIYIHNIERERVCYIISDMIMHP